MKNYLPFYIIIALLAGIFVFSYMEIGAVERELLEPAMHMQDKISADVQVEEDYVKLLEAFKQHEMRLNVFFNHTSSNDIKKCLSEIGNDIKYQNRAELEADTDRLIFHLKDIIDNEKPEINNIF
ncbi:MAG: DUF4363 family protein [Clostridia bacterium]|nr:DUF4363 family protein [Clostridia bacterium]